MRSSSWPTVWDSGTGFRRSACATHTTRDLGPVVPGEFRWGDTRHTVSDISRLRALGWEPAIPVEENVAEYVDWIRGQSGTKHYLEEAEEVMRQRGVLLRVER